MSEFRLEFDDYDVGVVYNEAPSAKATLIFAHGAGAGMRHRTMDSIAEAMNKVRISVLRFNFPYMEAGKNRVDSQVVSTATIKTAYEFTERQFGGSIFLGGHSFGGRMASHAVVDHDLDAKGLIFGSFPLHNPAKPSVDRAAHLNQVSCPMLFLSGSRDRMASHELMTQVADKVSAELIWLDTADHGYKVLKRTRTRSDDVFSEMASYASDFVERTLS